MDSQEKSKEISMFPSHGALLPKIRVFKTLSRRRRSYRLMMEVLEYRRNPSTESTILIGEDTALATASDEVEIAPPVDLVGDGVVAEDGNLDAGISDVTEPDLLTDVFVWDGSPVEVDGYVGEDLAGTTDEATVGDEEITLEDPQIHAEFRDFALLDGSEISKNPLDAEFQTLEFEGTNAEMLAYSSIPGFEFPAMPNGDTEESSVPSPVENAPSGIGEALLPVANTDHRPEVVNDESTTDDDALALSYVPVEETPVPVLQDSTEAPGTVFVTFMIPAVKETYLVTPTSSTPKQQTEISDEALEEFHSDFMKEGREVTHVIDGSGYGESTLPHQEFAGFPSENQAEEAPAAVAAKEE